MEEHLDFVEWCGVVLSKLQESSRDPRRSIVGLSHRDLAKDQFDDTYTATGPEVLVMDALLELTKNDLAERRSSNYVKITPTGRAYLEDQVIWWSSVCSIPLQREQQALLRIVNRHGVNNAGRYAEVNWVNHADLQSEWDGDDWNILYTITNELEELGLVRLHAFIGHEFDVCPSLRGLIWDSRREFTLESSFVDQLLSEGETTSVEIKRELYTNNENQKAEFIKDVLGLANTQASGKRWLIVGFDDKTHQYHGPPDPKLTQNHLEQLVSVYTSPVVDLRYEVINHRRGLVGRLEVVRDGRKLPYRVAKSVGRKKAIHDGDIFVRHGSQTEPPTKRELMAIMEEGQRARSVGN
jgi:hypothetical protein